MTDKKYIITNYQGRIISCLMSHNRLLSVNAQTAYGGDIGNIYIAKAKNVVKNLNAAFVEIADGELCYLSLEECQNPYLTNRDYDGRILQQDEIVVQLSKEPVKTKEAVVTTNLSFSGKYAVVTVGDSRIGYSNKLTKRVKEEVKTYLSKHLPDFPYGVVIRTNVSELTDYDILIQEILTLKQRCDRIFTIAKTRTCFSVLEQVLPNYLLQMRDMYVDMYDQIVTDDKEIYDQAKNYLLQYQPEDIGKLVFYEDTILPLTKLYALESKLNEALSKHVWLKSGGYLVIEPTEALTVIDVNSGKCTMKKNKEDTFFLLNKEAADEIALQLKLRNISGIVIIDFINMKEEEHKRQIVSYLTSVLKKDSIRTSVVGMTPLGLVEVTRKKVNKTLAEQLQAEPVNRQSV